MDITFGIITYKGSDDYIDVVIDSIEREQIPNYEVIVVGDYKRTRRNTTIIPFDETIKSGWITRKKNIITENAKNDIVVYSHDYIRLNEGFYNSWKAFGNDWDIAMNVIKNDVNCDCDISRSPFCRGAENGGRFRDWVVWDDPVYGEGRIINEPWCPSGGLFFEGNVFFPPYSYNKTECMYISGAYWLAKKHVMEREPLDESLAQAQGEDVEWSKRTLGWRISTVNSPAQGVRWKYKYVMNTGASVQLLKHQFQCFPRFNP